MFKLIYLIILCAISMTVNTNEYQNNIFFNFYKNNELVLRTNSVGDKLSDACDDKNEPWLILVPGWTQNCTTIWVTSAIEKFYKYRGGCIGCMDYYYYSWEWTINGYLSLRSRFDQISDVLLGTLNAFKQSGFAPKRGHMFSMSFGSQLAINAGRDFGGQIGSIDACDPAGPTFFPNAEYQRRGPSSLAAQNVQVIHTSCDEGTLQRDAHQDWLMGDCGINQAAAANSSFMQPLQMPSKTSEPIYIPFSRENHDMCPLFYLSAFENTFEAVVNPCCLGSNRDAAPAPSNYSMGYMQPDKGRVQNKTLHAYTYKNSPYNRKDDATSSLDAIEGNSIP